ncbi:MAG: ABC transporter permease subunit [Acholeplasmataceae bacterium]
MFSKALYKQSWKANWIQWLAIAVVSGFILTIIMLMSGGDGIGSLTSSFTETFVKDTLESEYQNTALNYHSITYENLGHFDNAFFENYLEQIKDNKFQEPTPLYIQNAYMHAVGVYQYNLDLYIKSIDSSYNEDSLEYQELMGVSMFALNPNNMFGEMYEGFEVGSTPLDYDIVSLIMSLDQDSVMSIWLEDEIKPDYFDVIKWLDRIKYRNDRSRYSASIFLAGNLSSDEALDKILESLEEVNIDLEIYNSFGFDYEGIKKIAVNTIIIYQSRLDYELSQVNALDFDTEEQYLEEVNKIKLGLRESVTETLIVRLPGSLADSMSEMQDYDVYTMTVGNMYFKLVGLLISVVFVIIIGVNLISGQVDSGSMVYILSTGTKRKTITFTQMVFFVSTTVFLYLVTSIISIALFYISPPTLTPVTVGTLLLFNLGSFLVTMTLGSIIYLTSCIFNRSKHAMSLGGGFAVLTLVFTILGMFASDSTPAMMRMEALNLFNSVSLVTLFDVSSIVDGTSAYLWKFGILIAITITSFVIGMKVFNKKDLPL